MSDHAVHVVSMLMTELEGEQGRPSKEDMLDAAHTAAQDLRKDPRGLQAMLTLGSGVPHQVVVAIYGQGLVNAACLVMSACRMAHMRHDLDKSQAEVKRLTDALVEERAKQPIDLGALIEG